MSETSEFYQLNPTKYTTRALLQRTDDRCIIFRHGHIAITGYHMGDNKEFEKALSVFDETRWKYKLKGGYYVPELHEFRINRGYNHEQLAKFFRGYQIKVENDAYPADKVDIKLLTPPKDDLQRVGITFICSQGEYKRNSCYTQQLIDADTGSGKAQPDDTMIPTPTGLRRLDSLKVGDEVFNINGYPVKVLAVYPQGKQETYEVTFKDGRTTRCNLDHLWEVIDVDNRRRVLSLRDIMKNYLRPSADGKHLGHRYAIPLPGPVEYDHQDTPIDPYVLGVLIGNGCLGEKALTISSGNLRVPVEVAHRIGYPTLLREYDNYSYKFVTGETTDKHGKVRRNYLQTKDYLSAIPELISSKSQCKFIPDVYKYNSVDVRMDVLRGLLDTDGSINSTKYQIRYSTTSDRLKDDIVELVRSLGYAAYVSIDKRDKYHSGKCYTIYIVCPNDDKADLFLTNTKSLNRARKAAECKTRQRFGYLNIIDIKKVKDTKQRCILIDDPRHVYISENYIPTHNTYLGAAASCFFSARTLVIVPITILVDQWKESYLNFTSITEDEILVVQGSNTCKKIMAGKYKHKKIFIMLADTISSFNKRYGDLETIELLRSMNVYLKIADEIHKEMKLISTIEALSNFHMNLYMSATPGRADSKENWIFKTCFWNIPHFGSKFKVQEEKHINIMVKTYRFVPDAKQIKKMVNPRKGWLNPKSYESVLLSAPQSQSEDFLNSLKGMIKWAKGLLKEGNKILILSETIDGTACMQAIAEEFFPGKTSRYYGTMKSAEDKKKGKSGTVICATTMSFGTGADVPGIQFVINITTYANNIAASQLPGRARPLKDGTDVWYIELVNMSYKKTIKQYEKRKPFLLKKSKTGKIMVVT